MVEKIHGGSASAESLVGGLDYFTVTLTGGTVRGDGTTGVDDLGVPHDVEQHLFDKIVEAISQKAQPVLLSVGGTGSTSFKFVVEHNSIWTETITLNGQIALDSKAQSLDTVIEGVLAGTKTKAGASISGLTGVTVAVAASATL